MCYPKPGPRCSSHAKKDLQKALKSKDQKAIKDAKEKYFTTPEGIQKLRDMGKAELANKAQAARKESIVRYKAHQETMNHIQSEIDYQPWEDSYKDKTKNTIATFAYLYGTPDIGRTRAVFDTQDGNVIKIPYTDEGFMANHREVTTSNTEDPYIPIAKCQHEEKDGVAVLVMEKVTPTKANYNEMPDWVMSVDCGQVGYLPDGRLVAYDL